MEEKDNGPILFFDGVCNLCNNAVQFVIKHDSKNLIRFATLQGKAGAKAKSAVIEAYGSLPDSLIFLDKGRYYILSDAALRLTVYFGKGWQNLAIFRFCPAFIRNFIYKLVSRNRYRIWGKKDSCMIPTPTLKAKFLD